MRAGSGESGRAAQKVDPKHRLDLEGGRPVLACGLGRAISRPPCTSAHATQLVEDLAFARLARLWIQIQS